MRVVKSILVGLVVSIAVLVLSVGIIVLTVIGLDRLTMPSGSPGVGAVSVGISEPLLIGLFVIAALAFAFAFRWQFNKASR
jgi:hypothetical protein